MENLIIVDSALDTNAILAQWQEVAKVRNFGAVAVFIGVVRAENGISALSFDIYMPLLKSWIDSWQIRAQSAEKNLQILMAHSNGDVSVGESSFMCAILSRNRKAALAIYDEFIEDFKANAPIWKYDIKDGARIYAKDRSKKLRGAGILEL
ncbi:molybdopterin synthase catalytic subunit [Helicobacter sp. 23-1045]